MSRKIMQYNLNYKNLTNYSSQIVKKDIATIKKNKQKINIFDLSQKLIPETVYNPIQCRKSAEFIVTTYLCVHKEEKDQYVSGSIIKNGVWESQILGPFTNYLNDNPDWLVLDVGAQIGDSYYLY